MTIENQLAALLKANGYLEFPGLGKFSINYQPAKIDYIQQKITPPGKFVSFDPNVKTVNSEDANLKGIDQNTWNYFIEGVKSRLQKKETVALQGLGSIYQDFRNEIHFIPSQLNYDDHSFGLSTIYAEPITRQASNENTIKPETKMPLTVKTKKWTSYVSELAFSVLIGLSLLTVGFGFWYAINTKNEVKAPSKFQIAESTLEGQRKLEDILDYDAKWATPGYYDEDSAATSNNTEELKVNSSPESIKKKESVSGTSKLVINKSPGKTYKIGVGSFASEKNANELIKKLSKHGFTSAYEHTTSGMNRVIVIKHCDDKEINNVLSNLRSKVNKQAYLIR